MTECGYEECDVVFEKQVHNQRYHSIECKRAQENMRRKQMVSDIAAAIAPSYNDYDVDEEVEEHLEFLRSENKRLGRAVDKYKNNKQEMLEAIYRAAHETFSKLRVDPVRPPDLSHSGKSAPEICNPFWGDFQCGKVTPSYNSEICRDRFEILVDKTIKLTEIQRTDHPVNHARVYMLGDMVEGEDIFPGQHWFIESSVLKQTTDVVEMAVDQLRRMLSTFESVHVVGVEGNHGHVGGRNHRYYHPDTNFDRLVYKFTEMMFRDEPRITFDVPEGRGEANYYTIDTIGDYSCLLIHGDQMPAPSSVHGYIKKINGWRAGAMEYFDDVAMGHYHQNTKMTIGDCVLRINGTPESDNQFAQKVVGAMGRPSQHLQFVSPTHGVTCEYDVYLD